MKPINYKNELRKIRQVLWTGISESAIQRNFCTTSQQFNQHRILIQKADPKN